MLYGIKILKGEALQKMATGGYNASFEETQTGFGNDSYDERQQENGKGYSGASATPLVGIDYKR